MQSYAGQLPGIEPSIIEALEQYDHLFCDLAMHYTSVSPLVIAKVWPGSISGFWNVERLNLGVMEGFNKPIRPCGAAYILHSWNIPADSQRWRAEAIETSDAPVRMPKTAMPIVYFLRAGPFIKIGFTAALPEKRISELNTGCPYKIKLLGAIRGTPALEKELHRRFYTHRANLEWFRVHKDILNYVRDHANT